VLQPVKRYVSKGVKDPEYRVDSGMSWYFSTGAGAGPGVDIFD